MFFRRLLLLAGAAAVSFAAKTSTAVEWNALPPAVQAAAGKWPAPANAARSYEKIIIDGATFFELKIKTPGGEAQEILFRPDGTVAETEEEIEMSRVPAPARVAIQKAAEGKTLVKVDVIRRNGKELYEGEIRDNGKKFAPVFDAAGKRVD